jgi:hypothetical protein
MDIYFNDLNEEAKQKVLNFYGEKTTEDLNFDVVPLFVLEDDEVLTDCGNCGKADCPSCRID